jgi:penicillin amidase
MNPEAAKRLRLLASAISLLLLVALLAVGWIYWRIRASLPQLEGTVSASGVSAPTTIERDAQGVPVIRGTTRLDVTRALGWLHGQERFFQMDLLRRSAAGELSELFGRRALPRDRAARLHGFRSLAQKIVQQLPAEQRALVEAYTAGVNAGLAALGEKPFEYLVLRDTPRPWKPEDTLLVIHAMALDLQDENAVYERSLMTLRDDLGPEALAFFAPTQTPDDAALDGTTAPLAPMPNANAINLRGRKYVHTSGADRADKSHAAVLSPHSGGFELLPSTNSDAFPFPAREREAAIGSNAFALAGAHTATGAGLLANDMHLDHAVPNTWYRASLVYGGRTVTGVTLPGAPAIVAGSNGHVAWGFTNSYIDTVDLVIVGVNSISRQLYTAPGHDAMIQMEVRKEEIAIKGDKPVTIEVPTTVWGPTVGLEDNQRPLALRWVMHDIAATDLSLVDMEAAQSVDDGIKVAHRAGIPAQNMLLADRNGEIAWTIAGRVPKRVGFNGRLPVSWSFGDRKWEGYLSSGETPVIRGADAVKPGRLWSGNQRHAGGEALDRLGDGAYRRPHRAGQIRDGLEKLTGATPKDLLAVQLDDRALFLERWHRLLLDTLTPAAMDGHKGRTALRRYIEKWEGRASTTAISYRLVREFRIAVLSRTFRTMFETCVEIYPQFDWSEFNLEPALWAMLEKKPLHLLPQPFATWDELLLAACDDVIHATDKQGLAMEKANWGWRNTARIRHPFSYSFPWLASWLDMPADPLPGGDDMPRVQSPRHGASERFVVSPGRETEGIFHMPGGQSGHPLSPFYRAGHEAWVRGEPTPFLPGQAQHTLTLQP